MFIHSLYFDETFILIIDNKNNERNIKDQQNQDKNSYLYSKIYFHNNNIQKHEVPNQNKMAKAGSV